MGGRTGAGAGDGGFDPAWCRGGVAPSGFGFGWFTLSGYGVLESRRPCARLPAPLGAATTSHAPARPQEQKRPVGRTGIRPSPLTPTSPTPNAPTIDSTIYDSCHSE